MRKQHLFLSAFAGLAMLFVATAAHAQTTTTGAIQGVVTDGSGAKIGDVTVVATSPGLQGSASEVTDDDGSYLLSSLPPGTYEVVFYYSDIKVRRQGVIVNIGSTIQLNQKMETGAAKGKDVIIKEKSHTIDQSGTKQETDITKDYVKNVPYRGRTYDAVLGAAAGSQGDALGVGFSGSQSVENNYVIDGINTTGLTYGDGGSPLINDFIQEIEVITGGYNAEFGRSTGGVVNVITKTGSNEFHGSVFANARPLEATRDPVFVVGNALAAHTTLGYDTDFGFEIGGPIIKDKVWFYVGFAPQLAGNTITRIAGTNVDRRRNDVNYQTGADGKLMDGDGNAATDPNPGCEFKTPAPGQLSGCETDNKADIDPKTGFTIFEEIERKNLTNSVATYGYLAKINVAANPDNQGQFSVIGSPQTAHNVGVVGTPLATQDNETVNTLDASGKWTSKFLDNKLELDAVVGWHHNIDQTHAIQAGGDDKPVYQFDKSDLGTVGRNPDQPESANVLQFCTDRDPLVHDDFPTITNCPVIGYRFNSEGFPTDREENRYTGTVSATYRLKLAGHHKIKGGADFEDNHLRDFSSYAGGKFYELLSSGRTWLDAQYARANPTGADICGMLPDGSGPDPTKTCDYVKDFHRTSETLNVAGYLQDSWQILPNLTLNVGVRYEEQHLKAAKEIQQTVDPLTMKPIGANALTLDNLWAPRIGALYDWTKEGRSKVYANWGRFYESVPLDINNRSFGGESSYYQYYSTTQCMPFTGPDSDHTPRVSDPTTCPQVPNAASPPVFDQWIGGGNPSLLLPPNVSLIMPGLKPQFLDEFVMGAEYEVVEDLRVGVNYQNRRLGRVIEDSSTDGANTYIIANPGEFSPAEAAKLQNQINNETDPVRQAALKARLDMFTKINGFDKPNRQYNAVQLTVLKRFSNNFFLQGSYTYARSQGNYPGLFSPNNGQLDPNITSQYDLIELLANRYGNLPNDRPHNFKLDGYYTFDLKTAGSITTGIRLRALSGSPVDGLGRHPTYGPNESFVLPRGAFGRTAFVTGMDLRLQYQRDLGKNMRLALSFDLFNVFNQQIESSVDEQYTIETVNPIVGGTKDDLKYLKATDSGGGEMNKVAQKKLNFGNTSSRAQPLSGRFSVRLEF